MKLTYRTSEQTLQGYTRIAKAKTGFSAEIDAQLCRKTNYPIIWLINWTQWPTTNETHVLVKKQNVEVHLKGGR